MGGLNARKRSFAINETAFSEGLTAKRLFNCKTNYCFLTIRESRRSFWDKEEVSQQCIHSGILNFGYNSGLLEQKWGPLY